MIGITKIIKIPGKSHFDQLNREEFAMLIESFLHGGDDHFDALAFDEFLHVRVDSDFTKSLQDILNANSFLPAEGNNFPAVNVEFLEELVLKLRSGKAL